jgi:hypothetical protein
LKLHFLPIWEYDPTQDKERVLGHPTAKGKMTPSLIQVYHYSKEGWSKLRGQRWRSCDPPELFCDVPELARTKYRKPSREKIESLDIATAMKYARIDEKLQAGLTEFVKDYLKKEFY